MILYHATFKEYINSIKEKGLMPKGQKENFDEVGDQCIYFDKDFDNAGCFAECTENTPDSVVESGVVVLAVGTELLDNSLIASGDPNIINNAAESVVRYYGRIPADSLMIMVRKYVKLKVHFFRDIVAYSLLIIKIKGREQTKKMLSA